MDVSNVYTKVLGGALANPNKKPPSTSPTTIYVMETSGRAKVEVVRKEGEPVLYKDIACAMQNIVAKCARLKNGGIEVVGKDNHFII